MTTRVYNTASFVRTFANEDDYDLPIVNYSGQYRKRFESITWFDSSRGDDDNLVMQEELSDLIRRRREEKGLSTRDVETVARSFMEIIDALPEEAGESAHLLKEAASVLPQGSVAITRTIELIKAKQGASEETFESPLAVRPRQKARSIELDMEVQDTERVRSAQRLLTEYSRHPERFGPADIDRIRAARRLRKAAERRRLVPNKLTT